MADAGVRHAIARWLWDRATWLYGPHPVQADDPEAVEWSIEFTIWATEKEAHEVFDRCSDAVCGTDHHVLDPCPGPMFVGGLHPVEPPVTSNPCERGCGPATEGDDDG